MISKMDQDGSRWLKMGPKMLQEAPFLAQDDSKWPGSLPRKAPKRRTHFRNKWKICMLCFLAFSLPMASEASRCLQEGPKGPQERPNGAQRRLQERPRAPQELSKRGVTGDFAASRGVARIE